MSAKTTCWGCLLVLVALSVAACGDRGTKEKAAGDAPGHLEALDLEPVTDLERAQFALDRLLKGPLPRTPTWRIPNLHPSNLKFAVEDLVLLPDETSRLLSDPALIDRLTGAGGMDHNPWHGVLDILGRLPAPPFDLVRAWTEPALRTQDVALIRRAIRRLAATQDAAAGPLLFEGVERWPTDREIAPTAAARLVALGEPWKTKVLSFLFAQGTASAQGQASYWLADGRGDEDALAWWALLLETGGPRPVTDLEPHLIPAWNMARIIGSPAAWPQRPAELDRALAEGRLLAPADLRDRLATDPTGAGTSGLVALATLRRDGLLPATEARCRLAAAGHAPSLAAVRADREGPDPLRLVLARDCVLPEDEARRKIDATFFVTSFLDNVAGSTSADAASATGALGALDLIDPSESAALAWRALREVRPVASYRRLIEGAHDLLGRQDRPAVVAWVKELAASTDPDERAVALGLIRRAPDARYIPELEKYLATLSDAAQRTAIQRLLLWVYARAPDIDADRLKSFAEAFAVSIASMPDPWASTLVSGLLDLGPEGARIYAEGLRGKQRSSYIQGLITRKTVVPLDVARALLEGVDANSSPRARQVVWAVSYFTVPTEAAGLLAAAAARVGDGADEEMADILEVVRHRARRPGTP